MFNTLWNFLADLGKLEMNRYLSMTLKRMYMAGNIGAYEYNTRQKKISDDTFDIIVNQKG